LGGQGKGGREVSLLDICYAVYKRAEAEDFMSALCVVADWIEALSSDEWEQLQKELVEYKPEQHREQRTGDEVV
jgi:hypothetical protein